MKSFLHRFYRAARRVFPCCVTQTQAVAFNMFLAFFPILLVILGLIANSAPLRDALRGLLVRLRPVLPPGAPNVLRDYLQRHGIHSWSWISLGTGATLLAGTQMMKLLMEGFCMVYGDTRREGLVVRHVRALLLLLATILPWIITMNLVVFGKQLRGRMLHLSSMPVLTRVLGSILYMAAALLIAMFVVSIIYRVGRPGSGSWGAVLPGAVVATALWWIVSAAFGYYMRHVPYGLVYGGLAVAIGLMLWMQLTATILFIGAAYNAERYHAADCLLPPDLGVH